MIKFFRHIRLRLLTENNTGSSAEASAKAGKYFRYAIGEIILVMIGILLALQVNNWNENRKQNIAISEYVKNLRSDIVEDTTALNDVILIGKRHIKEIENFKTYLLKSDYSLSNKIDSALNLNVSFYRYFPINQTYLDMQSSGSSKLLNQNQRNSLNNLLNQQIKISKANETLIGWAIEDITNRDKYMDRYGLLDKVLENPSTKEEMKFILRHHLNYLYRMEDMARTLTRFANEAKTTSDKVIKTLEE